MATELEVIAAKLLVNSSKQLGERVEPWVFELSKERPDGVPAYTVPPTPVEVRLMMNEREVSTYARANPHSKELLVTLNSFRTQLQGRTIGRWSVSDNVLDSTFRHDELAEFIRLVMHHQL